MQNTTIIIAGATKGLGRELAHRACKSNYPLALLARNADELLQLRESLENNNRMLISTHAVDLTDSGKTNAAFQEIAATHKKIYALANCAATWTAGKTVKELSAVEIQQSMQLNFFSTFNSIKALLDLPKGVLQKPAAIINVGATASLRGSKNCAAFAVAKGALRQLSQSMARELWPEDIHVAHLIIDGLIGNERTKASNPNRAADKFISMASLADTIMHVMEQEKSCWTFEWDVRPFNETW